MKFLSTAALLTATSVVVPVFAQSNDVTELSKNLIGSAFSNSSDLSVHSSRSNFGLIDSNSLSVNSVVNNIIDDDIRALKNYKNKKFTFGVANKSVQLLVPIKTGLEYSKLQKLIAGVKILEQSTGISVLVAEEANALPAYLLGKKIQNVLGYSFQLSYSDGHPDLNLAWLGAINQKYAKAPSKEIKPFFSTKVLEPKKVVFSNKASDLSTISITAPWKNNFRTAYVTLGKIPALPPLNEPMTISKLKNTNATKKRNINPSLINSVAIRQVDTGTLPISKPQYIAVNQNINYVYVKINTNTDLITLQQTTPARLIKSKDNQLLARVGVFSNTKLGKRLLVSKISELKKSGLDIQLYSPSKTA